MEFIGSQNKNEHLCHIVTTKSQCKLGKLGCICLTAMHTALLDLIDLYFPLTFIKGTAENQGRMVTW